MNKQIIVVTDLDGTLLDHEDYSFTAALPALRVLRERNIPLILNTSKTAPELLTIRQRLHNHEPFVVENGAGIYFPEKGSDEDDPYRLIGIGMNRAEVLGMLKELREKFHYQFKGFADMEVGEVMAMTGLSEADASAAMDRDFTEPLVWEDTEARFEEFNRALQKRNLKSVRGGRFIHISGAGDKGRALDYLRKYYAGLRGGEIIVIALGDSDNDVPLLKAADYPVVIKGRDKSIGDIGRSNVIRTEQQGPAGWNRAILFLLQTIGEDDHG